MVSKIIILSPIPISSKLHEDFYVNALNKEGIEVEYWDFNLMFNKEEQNKESPYSSFRIGNKDQFLHLLNENRNNRSVLIINAFTFCYRFLLIYRVLRKYDFQLATFARGALPTFASSKPIYQQNIILVSKIFKPSKWKNICQTLFILGLKYFGLTKKNDIIFQAGKNGLMAMGSGYLMDLKSSKKLININYFDYDRFLVLNEKNLLNNQKPRHIVFLDEFMPYHPDFDLLLMKKIDPVIYFKEINRFFRYIEDAMGLPVVIAAHPKAGYDINPFENRRIYYNQTPELVRDSSLVVAHASSSIGYGVCFEKKIILMSSNDIRTINNGYIQQSILGFKDVLGLQVVDLSDNRFSINLNELKLNYEKYNEYRYFYLTSKNSEQKTTQSIFLDFLKVNTSVNG